MEWIKCSDALPEPDELVLMLTHSDDLFMARLGDHKDTFFEEAGFTTIPVKFASAWTKIILPEE